MYRDRLLLAIVATPLILIGVGWGLPFAVSPETVAPWGFDEVAPLSPLTEAYCRFTRSGTKYLAYPLFHYIVLCVAYSPFLAIELLTGHLNPSSTFPYGHDSPTIACARLTLIARLVSSAMALGVVLTVYEIGRTLFDRRSAIYAGGMTAVLPTLVYYGKVSTVDVPYIFWLMLAALCVSKVLVHGDKSRYYVSFGIFSALAVCTKDQAVGFLVPYPLLFVAMGWQSGKDLSFLPRAVHSIGRRPLIFGLAASLATFAVAGNLLFGWNGFVRHVGAALTMSTHERMFDGSLAGQVQLARLAALLLAWTMGPAMLPGAIGVVALMRRRQWGVLAALALPPLTHHFLILGRIGYAYPRFLLPAAVFCALLGGAALHRAATNCVRRMVKVSGWLGAVYMILLSVCLDYALLHDARYDAELWIRSSAPPNARFATNTEFPRLLPRVWDNYVLVDPQAGAETTDYLVLVDFKHAGVESKKGNGQFVPCAVFDTPTLCPPHWVRLVNCTAPRVMIQRRRRPADPSAKAERSGCHEQP